MKFKVLKIECDEMNRNMSLDTSIRDRVTKQESFDNNKIFIYSVLIKTSGKSIGARNKENGKFEGLEEVMNDTGHELFKCRFIVFDTKNHNVYYDGDMNDVKILLKDYFDIEKEQITHVIDRDDLEFIKSLKISTKPEGQMVIEEPFNPESKTIDEMFDAGRIKERSYELIFADEGSKLLHRDRFNKLLDDSYGSTTLITAKGLDVEGRQVVLGSQIAKKVELLPDYSSWNDRINLSLDTIYIELGRKVIL